MRYRSRFALFALAGTALLGSRAEARPLQLTLSQCLERALKVNPAVTVSKVTVRLAEEAVNKARSAFFPELALEVGFTQATNATPYTYSDADGLYDTSALTYQGGVSGVLPTGTQYDLALKSDVSWFDMSASLFDQTHESQLSLSLTQPLLRGWGWSNTLASLRAAREARAASQRDHHGQLVALLTAVATAYWALSYYQESARIAAQSVVLAQGLLDSIRARVQAGTLSPLDAVEAEATIATREESLLVAKQTAKTAETVLLGYLFSRAGGDQGVTLGAELLPSPLPTGEAPHLALDRLVDRALKDRPDVLAAQAKVRAQAIAAAAADNGALPQLDLELKGGFTSLAGAPSCPRGDSSCLRPVGFMDGDHGTAWEQVFTAKIPFVQANLSLELPLSGDARAYDARVAALTLRSRQAELRQAREGAMMEVRTAYHQLRAVIQRVAVVRRRLRLARASLDAAQKKFKSGLYGSHDVLRVQLDLAAAEQAMAAVLRDQVISRLGLEAAAGSLPHHLGVSLR